MHQGDCTSLLGRAVLLVALVSCACALDNGVGLTPAMGFSTWNTFGGSVSDALLRETADAMASNGLLDAGYKYLNVSSVSGSPPRLHHYVYHAQTK
jgi:alpha-galactosidase